MMKIKNVILERDFQNDILLCNIKKGCLAILVHAFVIVLVFAAGYVFHPFLVVKIPSDGFTIPSSNLVSGVHPSSRVILVGSMA